MATDSNSENQGYEPDSEMLAYRATKTALEAARARAQARGRMTPESAALWLLERADAMSQAPEGYDLCACMGRRPGEPLCRCRMEQTVVSEGHWVHVSGTPSNPVIRDVGFLGLQEAELPGGDTMYMHVPRQRSAHSWDIHYHTVGKSLVSESGSETGEWPSQDPPSRSKGWNLMPHATKSPDSDPYAEGLDARLAGQSELANPYDPEESPQSYSSWYDGWSSEDTASQEDNDD